MIKKFFLLLFTLFSLQTFAQFTEVGIAAGVTTYQGDLSPVFSTDSLNIGQVNGAFGVLVRHNFNRFLAVRGGLTYGKASGDDRTSTRTNRIARNLRFETNIYEASAIVEFNIFGYDPVYTGKNFSPYLFVGAAGYYFNPKADFNGRNVELQPLGTEGQGNPGFGEPYSRFSLAIPFGGGLKFALGDTWTVGIEVGARTLFHDYLDDVSDRYAGYDVIVAGPGGETGALLADRSYELTDANPAAIPGGRRRGSTKFDDWYHLSMLTLTYHIPTNNRQRGKRRAGRKGNQMGCPTW